MKSDTSDAHPRPCVATRIRSLSHGRYLPDLMCALDVVKCPHAQRTPPPLAFIEVARHPVPLEPSCIVDCFLFVWDRCKQRLVNKAMGSAERTASHYQQPGGEALFKADVEA